MIEWKFQTWNLQTATSNRNMVAKKVVATSVHWVPLLSLTESIKFKGSDSRTNTEKTHQAVTSHV